MAGRERDTVSGALELWARWTYADHVAAGGRTMLAKLIDNKGELFFGGGGGDGMPADSIECTVEAAVFRMFAADAMRADVLRLEVGAAWWLVVARRKIAGYDPRGIGQFEKAHALGISLRTYKRRLAEARADIAQQLR